MLEPNKYRLVMTDIIYYDSIKLGKELIFVPDIKPEHKKDKHVNKKNCDDNCCCSCCIIF
jgi:hypothetical protein